MTLASTDGGHRGPSDRRASDAGTSLIEILAAVTLLGIVAVAGLGALGVTVNASGRHREHAEVSAVLVSAAEAVKAHPDYLTCVAGAGPLSVPAAYVTAARAAASRPTSWSQDTIAVESCVQVAGYVSPIGIPAVQSLRLTVTGPSGLRKSVLVDKADRPLAASPLVPPPPPGAPGQDCTLKSNNVIADLDASRLTLHVRSIVVQPSRCSGPVSVEAPLTARTALSQQGNGARWERTITLPAPCPATCPVRIIGPAGETLGDVVAS